MRLLTFGLIALIVVTMFSCAVEHGTYIQEHQKYEKLLNITEQCVSYLNESETNYHNLADAARDYMESHP